VNGNAMVQGWVEAWQYIVLEHEKGGPQDLNRKCNELGANGWEMVAAVPMATSLNGGATTSVRVFFKKRLVR
jgi:hypothetical protein